MGSRSRKTAALALSIAEEDTVSARPIAVVSCEVMDHYARQLGEFSFTHHFLYR
jgi:hypothetical protein